MNILTHPHEILRKQAADVTFFDDFLEVIVKKMITTLRAYHGLGIAAPQIGISRRIVVIDPSAGADISKMTVMVNPRIVNSAGEQNSYEGCLSVPGVHARVIRASSVDVEYQTLKGDNTQMKVEGFDAVIVQHEIDHLFGVLFIDRAFEISFTKPYQEAL